MARQNTLLDFHVEVALIRVCEDLTLNIEQTAKEICDEFEGTEFEASYESICAELQKAREVQIAENKIADRLYVEAP